MTNIKKEPRKGGFKVFGSGGGGKSGGSARTPVESPDSLHNISYATILDVISNGEVFGPAHPDDPLKDIYLDGTPIQNDDGSLNFERVETDYRVGNIDQEHIAGFPASSSITQVDVEVTQSTPWTQQIFGYELSALRVSIFTPTLLKTFDSGDNAGDRVGTKVDYEIDLATDGGSFVTVVSSSFDGKTVNGYTRTHRIELPDANNWTVRVRRLTPDSSSTTLQNSIYVSNYAEVIDGKFRHPMTAMVGLKIDAEQFQSIPTRAYHWKGRIIRVPSNYDPETREYLGVWDGTFKSAYSNNPAWVFYDILTNNLYGLGEYVKAPSVDRYALYQIGAYCDQMVDDGSGGLEPRFVANCYIQSANDALRVLNDLSSIFRGMAYWANNQVVPVADMPSDPVFQYTNSNVIDGKFEYSGTDLRTRKTVALVSWNDPSNFYKSKVEVVEDDDGIARYGIRKTEVVAFGCTSRGQAQRVGLYLLYTSRMETGGVSFSVGLDGEIPQPGSIIKIADQNRAGRQIGGRISKSGDDYIVTDRDHPAKVGDKINVNTVNGSIDSKTITAIDGRKITVSPNFDSKPSNQLVWSIDADDLVTLQARVISASESDGITYDISAVIHDPRKFEAIDTGVRLDPLPVSVAPPRTQTAPANIKIEQFNSFKQGVTRQGAEISWDAPEYAVQYDVQWKRDNGDWVSVPRTGTRTVTLTDIYSGEYLVRVKAINSLNVPSLWGYSNATQLDGIIDPPPVLSFLNTVSEVMAINLEWGYPSTANIISQVEIRASNTNSFSSSYPVTYVAYPSTSFTVNGLGYGTEMWFWARLLDKNGLAGEWKPLNTQSGVYGKSSESASEILEYLQGKISESELAQGLVTEIGKIDGIELDISGIETDISGLETQITNETQLRESADSALASDISTVAATASNNTAAIQTEQTARANADSALASDISTVAATAAGNTSAIQSEAQARSDADSALSTQINSVLAKANSNTAAIQNETTARANADSALASDISTLQTNVGNNTSSIQQTSHAVSNLDGDLKANWQVKTEVRSDGRVVQAGVGLGASIGEDGTTRSEFLVNADLVGFLNSTNGEIHAPFIFDTVNDTAILNSAIIGNATIDFAKISDTLQSTIWNWNGGDFTGWKIEKGGNVYFDNGVFKGQIVADSGTINNVVIEEDCEVRGKISANQIVGGITSQVVKPLRTFTQTGVNSGVWVDIATFTIANSYEFDRFATLESLENSTIFIQVESGASGGTNYEFRLYSPSLNKTYYTISGTALFSGSTAPYRTNVSGRKFYAKILSGENPGDVKLQWRSTSANNLTIRGNRDDNEDFNYNFIAVLSRNSGDIL